MSPIYPPERPEHPMGLLVVGVLGRPGPMYDRALEVLASLYGEELLRSQAAAFEWTDYYEPEMGEGLVRQYVAYDRLVPEHEIVAIKHETARVERTLAHKGRRRVNLDPGYVDFHRVVLASWKEGRHKIYLGEGVWADPVLLYASGRYHVQEWTFPDIKAGIFEPFFVQARWAFKDKLRSQAHS